MVDVAVLVAVSPAIGAGVEVAVIAAVGFSLTVGWAVGRGVGDDLS
jgi:hypothetical protein